MDLFGKITFLYLDRIHLIWAAVALIVVLTVLELRSQDRLDGFVSPLMQSRLAARQLLGRRLLRLALAFVSLLLAIGALMRPQTPGTTEVLTTRHASADIMVVLDVSRSMLAEDAAPNRLDRAKAEISELLGRLGQDRIGLVAFAGRSVLLCPLTVNHGFFATILRGTDTRSVARGGTRLGDAINTAVEAFQPGDQAKLILLITDGEDHDSFPLDAAEKAQNAGIHIVTIGFGSEEGSEIHITDPETGARTLLTDNGGNVVRSRLDGELLREIALRTDGVYVPAGVAALDLESIVEAHIEPLARGAAAEATVRVIPGEQYPWFVLGSLVALFAAVWIGSTGSRRGLA